jgi:hypothetical protein
MGRRGSGKPWMVVKGVVVSVMWPTTAATPKALHVGQAREGGGRVKLGQAHWQSHGRFSAGRNNRQHAGHRIPGIRRWDTLLLCILNLLQKGRIELVQVLRHQVGVHLHVGETLGVTLEVNFEIALGGEPVAADVALVGPLSSMGPMKKSANIN